MRLGVEGGKDYAFSDVFPHEALFDQLERRVIRQKGCYVGQEVVSRMQNCGTARRRIVPVVGEGCSRQLVLRFHRRRRRDRPRLGSTAGYARLAEIRLDRAAELLQKGEDLRAGETSAVAPSTLKAGGVGALLGSMPNRGGFFAA